MVTIQDGRLATYNVKNIFGNISATAGDIELIFGMKVDRQVDNMVTACNHVVKYINKIIKHITTSR